MKKSLYNKNGLFFWFAEAIELRESFEKRIATAVLKSLRKQNAAFHMMKVEAPLLTPKELINPGYTEDQIFSLGELVLRPETTMGSFEYAKHILSGYNEIKERVPVVIYQHGKSFRREQDQATRLMRLKEFYQLEFQIIFSEKTENDYTKILYPEVVKTLTELIGECRLEASDRLPSYSTETMDIICVKNNMEVCSMSKRTDYSGYKVIEVAIGTDRMLYNFEQKLNSDQDEDDTI